MYLALKFHWIPTIAWFYIEFNSLNFNLFTIQWKGRTSNPAVPYIIFAGVNLTVGLLSLQLPETKGVALPATAAQAAALNRAAYRTDSGV